MYVLHERYLREEIHGTAALGTERQNAAVVIASTPAFFCFSVPYSYFILYPPSTHLPTQIDVQKPYTQVLPQSTCSPFSELRSAKYVWERDSQYMHAQDFGSRYMCKHVIQRGRVLAALYPVLLL